MTLAFRLGLLTPVLLLLTALAGAQEDSGHPAAPPQVSVAEHRSLAEQRYLQGDAAGAERLFLALGRRPEADTDVRTEALVTAAWLRYLDRRDEEAAAALEEALRIDDALSLEAGLFDTAFTGLFEQARRGAEAERHAEIRDLVRSARAALESGLLDEAKEDFEAALRMDPPADERAHALYGLALAHMKTGDDRAAREAFEKVLLVVDERGSERLRAGVLVNLGTLQHRNGALTDAERSWTRATELDSTAVTAWRNLGIVRGELGNHAAALAALQVAHGLSPEHSDTARLLARTLVDVGSATEAVGILEDSLDRHPLRPDLWLALGQAARAAEQDEKAAMALSRSYDLDSDNRAGVAARAAAFMALISVEADEAGEAERWARSALAWEAANADYWGYLGMAQRRSGKLEPALESFRRALTLDPQRAESAVNVAGVLADLRRFNEAEELFRLALQLDPSHGPAAAGLAWIEERRAAPPAEQVTAAPRRGKRLAPKKLGVRFVDLDYDKLGLRGALVRDVQKRSPAARTGLRKGDLILRLDGYVVLDDKDFFSYLKRRPPVHGLEIEILREARIETLALLID